MFLNPIPVRHVAVSLITFGLALGVAQQSTAAEAGRVIGIRGSAVASTGAEEARLLAFDSAIEEGDTIVTASDAGLGLLVGSHYVGLDAETTAVLRRTEAGAPDLHVTSGRARVLDSGDGAQARLATNTLLAANAGSDTDIFAFAEKGGLVSMICPTEGAVKAARGGEALTPSAGGCAVAKAGEPLYPAKAGHDPLAMLAHTGGFDPSTSPVVSRGVPLPPVALGLGPVSNLATDVNPFADDPRLPCNAPGACVARLLTVAVVNPPPPVNPPVNPPGSGTPPGGGSN
jgi:hypothetical protein